MSRVCATRQSSSYASGAHRKRIAQAQAVTVGRARASDWSGSAATGREPPSDPWRGVVATGVARTGETRDAEVRRGAEAAGSREGPGPPDRNDKSFDYNRRFARGFRRTHATHTHALRYIRTWETK